MTSRLLFVMCALAGAACGAEDHPGQTPTQSTVTAADTRPYPAERPVVTTQAAPAPVATPKAPAATTSQTTADAPALTAMDQGNSTFETNVTAAIRKSVVNDSSLSFAAKNVKIITVGSKVTLRGQVSTAAEKARIDAFARQAAGVTDVDNQIEVKK